MPAQATGGVREGARAIEILAQRAAAKPTVSGNFSISADGWLLVRCATLKQRGSQSDRHDDYSVVPLALGRMGRCHRGLVDGGHSHAGANVAQNPPSAALALKGTPSRFDRAMRGQVGAATSVQQHIATSLLVALLPPGILLMLVLGGMRFGGPTLAILATGST